MALYCTIVIRGTGKQYHYQSKAEYYEQIFYYVLNARFIYTRLNFIYEFFKAEF